MNDSETSGEWEKLQEGFLKNKPQLQKQVCTELEPFLDYMRCLGEDNERFKLFRKAFVDYKKRYDKAAEIFMPLLEKVSSEESDLFNEPSLLFLYLGAIESIGNACVDILVLLLVANGRDFHIECRHATPRIRHLSSMKELEQERVSLTTKVNFLRDNQMERISAIIDSRLRNDIAHLNLSIKAGEIEIRGEPAYTKAFFALVQLMWTVSAVDYSLGRLAKDIRIVRVEGVKP